MKRIRRYFCVAALSMAGVLTGIPAYGAVLQASASPSSAASTRPGPRSLRSATFREPGQA
jgi:hypothetical protein